MLNRILLKTSPWGLLAAGLAVGIAASPGIRKGLRVAAVKTTKLALSVTGAAKSYGGKIGEGFEEIVSEAKAQQGEQAVVKTEDIKAKVHAAGVTAVGTGMAAVDKVKDVSGNIKQKWDDLVTEAKETKKDQAETVVSAGKKKAVAAEATAAKDIEPGGKSTV
jgi:hypothetical protein